MSGPYEQLIDATIQHLQELKAQGTRFVPVTAETFAGLKNRPAPAAVRPKTPTPASAAPSPAVPSARPFVASQAAVALPSAKPISTSTDVGTGQPAPLNPQAKADAIRDLRERALVCVKCSHLASSRKNVVFGVGDVNARLMFVGEAPGADEDVQGEPFVGAAGQLLTRIIQTMGLSRQTVYIANILKCRPDTPGQAYGNRKPTAEEMKTCIPYLHSQIDIIQPQVIVGLGATAVEGLLGTAEGITRLRGKWHTYRGIPLMPTFHPSYLLRNQALSEKRKVWEDMLQVMEKLDMPISEKQRGFFLKA